MKSGFEILAFSDLNYDQITVEIQHGGEQIAQINKDKGIQFMEIELLLDCIDESSTPKFLLDDFLAALSEAKKLLESS